MKSMRLNEKSLGIALIAIGGISFLFSAMEGHLPWSSGQTALVENTENTLEAKSGQRTACRVLTVYDGDTLGCDLNGNGNIEQPEEEIRLLGIDSPEMHYSRKNPTHDTAHPEDEPFAPQASRWLEARAMKKTVHLEFDVKRHDKYERTLAYVYPAAEAPVSFNEQLLGEGLARLLFLGSNRRYERAFKAVEARARIQGKGLWGK